MTIQVGGGSPATERDRLAARAVRRLIAGELPRIRAAATAWRNGLGALLAGLLGFGLIKGRTDVSQLDPIWAAVAGGLLLAALAAGGRAAWQLMRAAHGEPRAVAVGAVVDANATDPEEVGRLAEAADSELALRRGVRLFVACTAMLCAAVALTWYGPAKDKPRLEVRLASGSVQCGEVVSVVAGQLALRTAQGQLTVDLAQATGLSPVESCAPPTPPTP